jgi:hypothetical protein
VVLDGRGSFDANGDPLTFRWSLTIMPDASQATLSDPSAERPTFTADQPGAYTASLMVHDGIVESVPDQVTIIALSTQTRLTQILSEAIALLNGFDPAVFKNSHMQSTLTKKIGLVIEQIQQGAYEEALQKLEQDILAKLDGCAAGTSPAPDPNDWIRDCSAQVQVYSLLLEAIDLLASLL